MTQTVKLTGPAQRAYAHKLIDAAPDGYVIAIKEPTRNLDQNAKLWAMLTDISQARPMGREATPEVWKNLLMSACGHECQFEMGIDGRPFPVGFRSSRLSVRQMADLIEYAYYFGNTHGVTWSEPNPDERAA